MDVFNKKQGGNKKLLKQNYILFQENILGVILSIWLILLCCQNIFD